MATKHSQDMNEFSFFNEEEKIKAAQEKTDRRRFMRNITIGAGAVALTAYGVNYGVSGWLEANRQKKIEKVKEIANKFKNNKTLEFFKDYKKALDSQYSKNMNDLLDFAKYKDLITVFNLKMNFGIIEKNNNTAYADAIAEYKAVLNDFQKIVAASENENLMKGFIEDSNSVDSLIKAQKYVDLGAYNEKSEDYKAKVKQTGLGERLTKLTNVENEIKNDIKDAESIKEEMLVTIMSKIKSGDYNLTETQKALTQDMMESTNSEMKDLLEVRESLKDSEFSKDFTDEDLREAKASLSELETSLIARVVEDKQTIEKMIAKVSSGQELKAGDAGTTVSAASPLVNNNTTNSNNGGGWGAFEYYLLYNWLAGGSRTTPAMAASHTSSFAQTSGKNLERKNGNYVAPVMGNAIGAQRINSNTSASTMYNPRVANSYISNSIPQRAPSTRGGMTPFQAKQKIEGIKARGRQATQARRASIARAQAARAQAQAARSSSSSRSSFSGGRGGGGSGG